MVQAVRRCDVVLPNPTERNAPASTSACDTAVPLADGGRLVVSGAPADHGEREVPGVADIDDRQ
jgi:hypothetical protein